MTEKGARAVSGLLSTADEWVRWALAVELPEGNRSIGRHAVGRVLVALAMYAGRDGTAYPGAQTLADDVSGLTRRDVRNALAVLSGAGVIEADGKGGRGGSVRWRLNVAGDPATAAPVDNEPNSAGDPATAPSLNSAGNSAGNMAGHSAGDPAPNRTELNSPLPPHAPQPEAHPPRRETGQGGKAAQDQRLTAIAVDALAGHPSGTDLLPHVVAIVREHLAAGTTAVPNRLAAVPAYRADVITEAEKRLTRHRLPEWCGECDERTRMRETPPLMLPARCAACHPSVAVKEPA